MLPSRSATSRVPTSRQPGRRRRDGAAPPDAPEGPAAVGCGAIFATPDRLPKVLDRLLAVSAPQMAPI
jgi:hypothetical protein